MELEKLFRQAESRRKVPISPIWEERDIQMEMKTWHIYEQIDKSLIDYVIDANKGFGDFCAINFLGKKIRYSIF